MAIGKASRMSSVRSSLRAPKFLDKASGFYGRLDEPAACGGERDAKEEEEERQNKTAVSGSGPKTTTTTTAPVHAGVHGERREVAAAATMETFDFGEGGLMEDDGETLLRRKPSRRSSRWRRSSRKKQQKEEEAEEDGDAPQDGKPAPGADSAASPPAAPEVITGTEPEGVGSESAKEKEEESEEPATRIIHFREEEDDQVLIRDKKRGREEEEEEGEEEMGEEERRMRREQEQGMKVVKRHTVKNYRKALDRAFRRGWEVFVANLYSVTLAPVTPTPSPSPSSKTKHQHCAALAEFR